MIVFDITNTENDPTYTALAIENGLRQYDFLRSMVAASLSLDRPFLSSTLLKALNFQAIACLHTSAGEYRPCEVGVGNHRPAAHYRVRDQMEDFVNLVNRRWSSEDSVVLAAYVLWRLNYIHPFINGNGRTARAACYFVLCVSAGGWLAGSTILPELIKRERVEYVEALREADQSFQASAAPDLARLHQLLMALLGEQMASAGVGGPASNTGPSAPPPPAAAPGPP